MHEAYRIMHRIAVNIVDVLGLFSYSPDLNPMDIDEWSLKKIRSTEFKDRRYTGWGRGC